MSIIHIAILNLLLYYQEIKLLLFLKDPGLGDIQLGGGSYLSEHLSTHSIDPPHSNSGATFHLTVSTGLLVIAATIS